MNCTGLGPDGRNVTITNETKTRAPEGEQFHPLPSGAPIQRKPRQMTPPDLEKSNTTDAILKGTGSPSPFLITVTKEGHVVIRLPLSLLKWILTGLGVSYLT